MSISRERAAAQGQETQRIVAEGQYIAPGGAAVDLRPLIEAARAGTRSYPPESALPEAAPGAGATRISVTGETTLAAARRLVSGGLHVAALNFASARHPGGGWLSGARAQEESLARASALVACVASDPMYERHARMRDALYTSSAVYSPGVPIFRDDDGRLLDEPYQVAIITAPAVNAKVVLERDPGRREEVRQAMRERVARVLGIAAAHRHDALVLGAWGCGVFGNDPAMVAGLFADALAGPFAGVFAEVVFAVFDPAPDRRSLRAFERAFAG